MPTNDVIPIIRDINILLALDTYQGMSDDEIESVIEFKISEALTTQENINKMMAINYQTEQAIANDKAVADMAKEVLQYRKERTIIPWVTIAQDGTVNINV